jgi:hypothetical protein
MTNAEMGHAPFPIFFHSHKWRQTGTMIGQRRKKSRNLHKRSCGFATIRIDHGHRRGGHDPVSERAISSVGRAPRLHRGCRRFESVIAHHFPSLFVDLIIDSLSSAPVANLCRAD